MGTASLASGTRRRPVHNNDRGLIGSGIAKRFGKRLVLDGAELVLRPGEVIALAGENGTGKTSFLRSVPACSPRTRARSSGAGGPATARETGSAGIFVALMDYIRWSLYGAPWLQPVAIGRKQRRHDKG
jgi:ABC-type molybdenum transport system ATPase subunit/photorepair protein PhrA